MKVEVAVLGSPSLIVLNKLIWSLMNSNRGVLRAEELCESRGGHSGLPVPNMISDELEPWCVQN